MVNILLNHDSKVYIFCFGFSFYYHFKKDWKKKWKLKVTDRQTPGLNQQRGKQLWLEFFHFLFYTNFSLEENSTVAWFRIVWKWWSSSKMLRIMSRRRWLSTWALTLNKLLFHNSSSIYFSLFNFNYINNNYF